MSSPSVEVRDFGCGQGADLAGDLASLHCELLPRSPLAHLGERFLAEYYYLTLPRLGLMLGSVCYVDGVPAGFIAATQSYGGFIATASRRAPMGLASAMARSLVGSRQAWRGVAAAMRIGARRAGEAAAQTAELLSLGVRAGYRAIRVSEAASGSLALLLCELTLQRLRAGGARAVVAAVDADNRPARIFYSSLGWQLVTADAAGWDVPVVEYRLEFDD